MKILTIVGARPQFIKAAMVSKAIAEYNRQNNDDEIVEEIVHTGQHYDDNMSDVFFDQMGIPKPMVRMEFGGCSHGAMTGQMLEVIEKEILKRKPDLILVYGDTNSTLAGALASVKLHVPVAHVEARLRFFNKEMPEEINRIVTDHVSSLLFCPTTVAVQHLKNEGITDGVYHIGDVMYDAAIFFGSLADKKSMILDTLELMQCSYYLATVHRQENTDDPNCLKNIISAFDAIATEACPLVLPLHPRTKKKLVTSDIGFTNPAIKLISPLSFLDMVKLERNAKFILTDSGGVQKEAYFHRIPCVTLRDETEWVETVDAGWNQVVGTCADAIVKAVESASKGEIITDYGNGHAAQEIIKRIMPR